jgi:hypothetical protein
VVREKCGSAGCLARRLIAYLRHHRGSSGRLLSRLSTARFGRSQRDGLGAPASHPERQVQDKSDVQADGLNLCLERGKAQRNPGCLCDPGAHIRELTVCAEVIEGPPGFKVAAVLEVTHRSSRPHQSQQKRMAEPVPGLPRGGGRQADPRKDVCISRFQRGQLGVEVIRHQVVLRLDAPRALAGLGPRQSRLRFRRPRGGYGCLVCDANGRAACWLRPDGRAGPSPSRTRSSRGSRRSCSCWPASNRWRPC